MILRWISDYSRRFGCALGCTPVPVGPVPNKTGFGGNAYFGSAGALLRCTMPTYVSTSWTNAILSLAGNVDTHAVDPIGRYAAEEHLVRHL
jgi:hypothetical protein